MSNDEKAIPVVNPLENQEQLSNYFIQKAYQHLEGLIGDGKLTLANAVGLTVATMQYMETMKGIDGVVKKFVVMNAIKRYIKEHISDKQEQMDLLIFADMTLPSMIDTFIQIDLKEIVFNVKKGCIDLFTNCCTKKEIQK